MSDAASASRGAGAVSPILEGLAVKLKYASQYQTLCVVFENGDTADQVIERCRRDGALFFEDGPDDEGFVVTLRPEIGPEIWTEAALRRSIEQKGLR